MKKFVSYTLLLAVLLFVCVGAMVLVALSRTDRTCRTDCERLFVGNSRVEYGVNVAMLPSSANLGINADNYFGMYQRLRIFHRANPQLSELWLQFDGTVLYRYVPGIDENFHPYFYSVMDASDWLFLLRHDSRMLGMPFSWLKWHAPLRSVLRPMPLNESGLGGYMPLVRDRLYEDPGYARRDSLSRRVGRREVDDLQQVYLDKILSYCRSHHIDVVFFAPPIYPSRDVLSEEADMIALHDSLFASYPFVDYYTMALPDSCYGDMGHVNFHGADAYSTLLSCDVDSVSAILHPDL